MKTERHIRLQLKMLKEITEKVYGSNSKEGLALMNLGSVNALEWVLE